MAVSTSTRPVHIVLLFGAVCLSVPLPEPAQDDFWETTEETSFLEGDLVLGSEVIPVEDIKGPGRSLVADPHLLWPDKVLYYDFSSGFSPRLRLKVEEALQDMMNHSCVRFTPRHGQKTYLKLRMTGKGCATMVGYQGGGALDLHVGGRRCHSRGTVQHEFLHALGFWHEHTRPDRDKHILVLWENVRSDRKSNFVKRGDNETFSLGLPYDYASVMHYRHTAFARHRGLPTLVPKIKEAVEVMGQRRRLSMVDIAKLNRLYNCSGEYYRGDDLEGVDVVIGEVRESQENTGVKGGGKECEEDKSQKYPKKNKCAVKILQEEILDSKVVNEEHYEVSPKIEGEISELVNLESMNSSLECKTIKQIMTSEICKNISKYAGSSLRVKRETTNAKTPQTVPSGGSVLQQDHESFAPQKILPELLKGVLNNDNDRPIVIQFAFYQPVVYKNQTDGGDQAGSGNKSKPGVEPDRPRSEVTTGSRKGGSDRKSQGSEQREVVPATNIRQETRSDDDLGLRSLVGDASLEPRGEEYRRPQNEYILRGGSESRDVSSPRKEYTQSSQIPELREYLGPRREYDQSPRVSETRKEYVQPSQDSDRRDFSAQRKNYNTVPQLPEIRDFASPRKDYTQQSQGSDISSSRRDYIQPLQVPEIKDYSNQRKEYVQPPQFSESRDSSSSRKDYRQPSQTSDSRDYPDPKKEYIQPSQVSESREFPDSRKDYSQLSQGSNSRDFSNSRKEYIQTSQFSEPRDSPDSRKDYNYQSKMSESREYPVPRKEFNQPSQGSEQRDFSVPRKDYSQSSQSFEPRDYSESRREYIPPSQVSETRDFPVSNKDYSQSSQFSDSRDYSGPRKEYTQLSQVPDSRDFQVSRKEYFQSPQSPESRDFLGSRKEYFHPSQDSDSRDFLGQRMEYHKPSQVSGYRDFLDSRKENIQQSQDSTSRDFLGPRNEHTQEPDSRDFTVQKQDYNPSRQGSEIREGHVTVSKNQYSARPPDLSKREELFVGQNPEYVPQPRLSQRASESFAVPKMEITEPQGLPTRTFSIPITNKNYVLPSKVSDAIDEFFSGTKKEYVQPSQTSETRDNRNPTPKKEYIQPVLVPQKKDDFFGPRNGYQQQSQEQQRREEDYRQKEYTTPPSSPPPQPPSSPPQPRLPSGTDDHDLDKKEMNIPPLSQMTEEHFTGPKEEYNPLQHESLIRDEHVTNPKDEYGPSHHDPETFPDHFLESKEGLNPPVHDSGEGDERSPLTKNQYSLPPKVPEVKDEHLVVAKEEFHLKTYETATKDDHGVDRKVENMPLAQVPLVKDEHFVDHKDEFKPLQQPPPQQPSQNSGNKNDDLITSKEKSEPITQQSASVASGDARDILQISKRTKNDQVRLSNPVRISGNSDEPDHKERGNEFRAVEDVNPDWKGVVEVEKPKEDRSKNAPTTAGKSQEDFSSSAGQENKVRRSEPEDTSKGEVKEEENQELTQEERDIRVKQKHDLFIREDFNDQLDKDLRKKKLEQVPREDSTSKVEIKIKIEEQSEQKQDLIKGKEQGVNQKRGQPNTRLSPSKTKSWNPRREVQEDK